MRGSSPKSESGSESRTVQQLRQNFRRGAGPNIRYDLFLFRSRRDSHFRARVLVHCKRASDKLAL